jgi:hypothetical protein
MADITAGSSMLVALFAGLFCLYMAPAFWWDWLAASEVPEDGGGRDAEPSGVEGLGSLLHAVIAAVFGLSFLAFAAHEAALR